MSLVARHLIAIVGVLVTTALVVGPVRADPDGDGDGVSDAADNCPTVSNPEQTDTDRDGIGDACDACTDRDRDGFGDPGFPLNTCPVDNCPDVYNPAQIDGNGDGRGEACQVCDALGGIHDLFPVAFSRKLTVAPGKTHGYATTVDLYDDVCTTNLRFSGGTAELDLVAVASTGRAATVTDAKDLPAYVTGYVFTGGGTVLAPPDIYTDTTGTAPEIADCRRTLATMVTASATLGALPATQHLGTIAIAQGSTFTVTAGEGEVVDIDSITIVGKENHDYGCYELGYGTLVVHATGPGVVLNVRNKLVLGTCAEVYSTDATTIINAPGIGKTVRIGAEADLSIPVLAPLRNVVVTGANDDGEVPTTFLGLWGKTGRMNGYTMEYQYAGIGDFTCTPP